jgi:hypothetical protein
MLGNYLDLGNKWNWKIKSFTRKVCIVGYIDSIGDLILSRRIKYCLNIKFRWILRLNANSIQNMTMGAISWEIVIGYMFNLVDEIWIEINVNTLNKGYI